MSIIDQIKLANAGRRMYNRMCNSCRRNITNRFAKDYMNQTTPENVEQITMDLLCSNCKKVYKEAKENK